MQDFYHQPLGLGWEVPRIATASGARIVRTPAADVMVQVEEPMRHMSYGQYFKRKRHGFVDPMSGLYLAGAILASISSRESYAHHRYGPTILHNDRGSYVLVISMAAH